MSLILTVLVLLIPSIEGINIVHTRSGPVTAHECLNGSLFIYKNIPFARQPIGDLRFELSEDVGKLEKMSNQENRIICPQIQRSSKEKKIIGQEDCLFLDVYSRKVNNSTLFPVLIFFHPGEFSYGSKEDINLDFFLNLHDIVLVVPNYRLGILGFLSAEKPYLSGNMGLWDQRMAMKWVQDNIHQFGGDPSRVTISGHEAGGSSVGYHILSPLSHKLFRAAISSSGTALDPRAISYNSSQSFAIVTKELKCSSISQKSDLACIKLKTMEDILRIQDESNQLTFKPTIDFMAKHPFLPYSIKRLYKMGFQKNVSYVIGINRREAYKEVIAIKTQHLDGIVEHLLSPYIRREPNFELIANAAKYHYLKEIPIITSFNNIEPQMTDMMTDFLYLAPSHITLKLHSKKTSEIYMYILNYEDNQEVFWCNEKINSAGEDICNTFLKLNDTRPYSFNNHEEISSDLCRKSLSNIWEKFIKSILPEKQILWKTYEDNQQMNYIEISNEVKIKKNYRRQDIEFWIYLVPHLKNIRNSSSLLATEYMSEYEEDFTWGAAGVFVLFGVFCIALIGVVIVTKKKLMQSSIIPISSKKVIENAYQI